RLRLGGKPNMLLTGSRVVQAPGRSDVTKDPRSDRLERPVVPGELSLVKDLPGPGVEGQRPRFLVSGHIELIFAWDERDGLEFPLLLVIDVEHFLAGRQVPDGDHPAGHPGHALSVRGESKGELRVGPLPRPPREVLGNATRV